MSDEPKQEPINSAEVRRRRIIATSRRQEAVEAKNGEVEDSLHDSSEEREEASSPRGPEDADDEEVLQFELPERTPVPPVKKPVVPRYPPPKKIETLEDIYATFPDIGDGVHRLKVDRVAPRSYGSLNVAGFQGYVDEKISLEDFARVYGGGRYEVGVIGPAGKPNEQGIVPQRQLSTIEISLPGPPNVFAAGDDMSSTSMFRPGYGTPMPQQEHPTVAKTRVELEYKERERERQMFKEASQTPDYVIRSVQETAQRTVDDVKTMAENQLQMLRDQNIEYAKQIAARDTELSRLRDEILKLQTASMQAVRDAEGSTEKRLREMHEKTVEMLKEANRREVDTIKDRMTTEMQNAQTAHNRTIAENAARYSEDLARRMEDAKTSRDQLRESYENRLSELHRQHDRELQNVKDQRDREIASIKSNYDNSNKMVELTAKNEVSMHSNELTRLRSRVETLEKENERLVKASVKDPVTYLTEVKTVAGELLGMVNKEDAVPEKEGSDEAFDWKKEAAKAAVGFVQKLPDMAREVGAGVASVRQQNAQVHAQAAQAQAQAQGFVVGPNGRRVPVRRGWATPPPPAYEGPVHGAEIPYEPPRAPLNHQPMPGFSPLQAEAVPVPSVQEPAQPPAAVPPAAPAPAATAPAPAPTASVPEGQPSQEQMTRAFMEFCQKLEEAIGSGIVTPDVFAKALVEQIGTQQAAGLLKQLPVEQFFRQVESFVGDRSTLILQRDGRKFVQGVWTETAKLVSV